MAPLPTPSLPRRFLARAWARLRPRAFRLRPLLLGAVVVFIVVQIVALMPSSLETNLGSVSTPVEPDALTEEAAPTLAAGIPTHKIPAYSVNRFNYVSTQGTEKQWNLIADKAYMYNDEKLVHSRNVVAYIYDPSGKATVVTGREAKYFMNKKDLEIYGDVKTTFADGFHTESDYLRYLPDEKRMEVPRKYFVKGWSNGDGDKRLNFESQGIVFSMRKSEIVLPERAKVILDKTLPSASPSPSGGPSGAAAPTHAASPLASPRPSGSASPSAAPDTAGVPDRTVITSDQCVIDRKLQIAHFTMYPSRQRTDGGQRYVHITQPKMYARSRRADLNYGDYAKLLNYMVAFDDVLIRETDDEPSLKYATSGRADFDTHRDVIVLTQYPQVYQDNDTVAGDIILMHRDTDIVEVEHSNAFSDGKQDQH